MKVLDPRYVAGILDGEGSIFTRERGTPYVSVANVNRTLIDRLGQLGGAIQDRTGRTNALGGQPIWEWTIVGERAALVLRACAPHMIVKAGKAHRAVTEWDEHTFTMKNPRKRRTHILAARGEMTTLGWPVGGPVLSFLRCRNGHPMTDANTYLFGDGKEVCLLCKRARG